MKRPDPSKPRVRLIDIAREAGVSTATVSLALRNHPRISAETKERILSVAQKLGYRPDPALQALARYRVEGTDVSRGEAVAYLTPKHDLSPKYRKPNRLDAFRGAKERAQSLGYALYHFPVGESPRDWKHLQDVLLQRGIRGIILAPPVYASGEEYVQLDWSRFSAVAMSQNVTGANLSLVQPDSYLNGQLLVKHLRTLGHHSASLYIGERYARWTGGAAMTALLEPENTDTIKVGSDLDAEEFLSWFKATQPRTIITNISEVPKWLKSIDLRVPEDTHVAFLDTRCDEALTGITIQASVIGSVAMDLLHTQLVSLQYGPPRVPLRVVVDGYFNPGTTLRQEKDRCA